MIKQFKKDVEQGLSSTPKTLSSQYFYDKKGSELFIEIMNLPEYYLTRSEFEIFNKQSNSIIEALNISTSTYFELIELGAGDGTKTKQLLKGLSNKNYNFKYLPIDISLDALNNLEESLKNELPQIEVIKKHGTYFQTLESIKDSHHPKVILFLGSNIGNMTDDIAEEFMTQLSENLNPGDQLLLGVDLIKSKNIVLPAYNDSNGITKEFNLNLLHRINKELDGNFNIEYWKHSPKYSEKTGVAESYIESVIKQSVTIKSIGKTFYFEEGEQLKTETSRKYNDTILKNIIKNAKFSIFKKFTDSNNYFCNYLLVRH
ncbi:L-histidine N(alpha)-methyltransferase [Flavobacteriaceae bacterium AU392]|nr:L-histidine N(alpha)-methyltransferase [Flavobacteriaceae bacterium]RKM85770.1 L-histidine N(alpha)-methyltransferase [Flavobacteriaceae bacterium AU392]